MPHCWKTSHVLILAFDTATDAATSALVMDGELLGERISIAQTVLEDIDALLRQASARPRDLDGLVVGTGPGSFTSIRIGLAVARGLGLALDVPGAGVSTLDALEAGSDGARAVIDARRGEVFVAGPRAFRPDDLDVESVVYVGSGAVRYRGLFEARGGHVPPDDDPRHLPRAVLHARLAKSLGPVEAIEPIYVRQPDVGRAHA